MYKLNNDELNDTIGGARLVWKIIGAAASFLAGFITGWFNPSSCNK